MKYFHKVLLGLDQFANTLTGGYPDETMSARAGRNRNRGRVVDKVFWKPLAAVLNKIQPNHVEMAEAHEEDGSQNDPEYRDAYRGSSK